MANPQPTPQDDVELRDIYDNISPIDFRFWLPDVAHYVSENGFTRWKLAVERALLHAFETRRLTPPGTVRAFIRAEEMVRTAAVYREERRIGHDIRALVNVTKRFMEALFGKMTHAIITSWNTIDTANAARYYAVTKAVVIPALLELVEALVIQVETDADTPQIGRSHLQHGEPITFGFALAWHASRLSQAVTQLNERANQLSGSMSGAMGSSNAATLLFDNPEDVEAFEGDVVSMLGLPRGEISTQIGQPEAQIRFFMELQLISGILANLADDIRHLQRTEVGEVYEPFNEQEQVGSSIMPHKKNPIASENTKSIWKMTLGRFLTIMLDQISEHQRDLTNSASSRSYGEQINLVTFQVRRMTKVIKGLVVNREQMLRNLRLMGDLVMAEPLSVLLLTKGCSEAHEICRQLTMKARANMVRCEELDRTGSSEPRPSTSFVQLALQDEALRVYIKQFTARQIELLGDPVRYTGVAAWRARKVAAACWERSDHLRTALTVTHRREGAFQPTRTA